jgi:phosphoglucosamine mutase
MVVSSAPTAFAARRVSIRSIRPTIRRLGAALARGLASPARFLSGRDTRESGAWIERELAFGIATQGGSLTGAGIIPTPAIAYLTPRMGYTAGVVISASHNPFEDNGIKVFSGAGEKFTEELEQHVESIMADQSWGLPSGEAPEVEQIDYRAEYLAHLRAILPNVEALQGKHLIVDCANGATTTIAPRLFQELGFEVRCIGANRMVAISICNPGRRRRSSLHARLSTDDIRSASPTTGMAIARYSSMNAARSSTATR